MKNKKYNFRAMQAEGKISALPVSTIQKKLRKKYDQRNQVVAGSMNNKYLLQS